jgi:membrane-associated phospholipid phosphatase
MALSVPTDLIRSAYLGTPAGYLGSYHKSRYRRPRPAQAWAPIAPTIATPGHPAYPSGHATQAFLLSEFVKKIAPELKGPATVLANRIARNREIAGVHYRSDSKAGAWIAAEIMQLLDKHKGSLHHLMEAAEREWRSDSAKSHKVSKGVESLIEVKGTLDTSLFPVPPYIISDER